MLERGRIRTTAYRLLWVSGFLSLIAIPVSGVERSVPECEANYLGVARSAADPEAVRRLNIPLKRIDQQDIRAMRAGKSLGYYIDDQDHFWISRDPIPSAGGPLLIRSSSGEGGQFVAKENGIIHFNPANSKYELKRQSGQDLAQEEIDRFVSDLKVQTPGGSAVERPRAQGDGSARVLSCLDIINQRASGKGFIRDRIVSANVVTGSAILLTEAAGAHRLSDPKGREVVVADLLGSNAGAVVSALLGKNLSTQATTENQAASSKARSMATRAGVGLAQVQAQNVLFRLSLTEKGSERSDKILTFDRAYVMARAPFDEWFDSFLVKDLPARAFDACKKGSPLRIVISPSMVRIYERFASSTLYFGARKAAIDE